MGRGVGSLLSSASVLPFLFSDTPPSPHPAAPGFLQHGSSEAPSPKASIPGDQKAMESGGIKAQLGPVG